MDDHFFFLEFDDIPRLAQVLDIYEDMAKIEKAKYFAQLIADDPDFELVSEPELNILTYRYVPSSVSKALERARPKQREQINSTLDALTIHIQKTQRQRGKAFVSRTRLMPAKYNRQSIVVLRVVLANPLTTETILQEVLAEQKQIATEPAARDLLTRRSEL